MRFYMSTHPKKYLVIFKNFFLYADEIQGLNAYQTIIESCFQTKYVHFQKIFI